MECIQGGLGIGNVELQNELCTRNGYKLCNNWLD